MNEIRSPGTRGTMRAVMVFYGLLIGGLALMLLPGWGFAAFLVYVFGMPLGAAALWWSQGYTWREAGLHPHSRALRDSVAGTIGGAAAVIAVFGMLHAAGWAALDAGDRRALTLLGSLIIPQCGVAIIEEFTFRGVIQQLITARWGSRLGLSTASLLFGVFHIPNILYHDVPLGHIPITIAVLVGMGFLWGWAFLRTGRYLALPVALHWGWNVAAYGIQNDLIIRSGAPAWLIGSPIWFPESGLGGALGLALLLLLVWVLTHPQPSPPANQ